MERGGTRRTSLREVVALHRGSDEDWTWEGHGTPYPNRKIDYLLHSKHLIVLQAQVFDSKDLHAELPQSLQFTEQLSRTLSPHRPVVADFAWP